MDKIEILKVTIENDEIQFRMSSKKSGLNLWKSAIVVARAAIRLQGKTVKDFTEDLFNPDIIPHTLP